MQVLIAGGGIGGLTAALCFHRRGFEAQVLEQAPRLGEVGAGIQLSPNAMQVLRHLGCAEDLQRLAFEPEAAAMRHHRSGKALLTTPLGEAHRRRYGAPYLHVHRADLLEVLHKALQAAGVPLHLGAGVRGFRQDEEGISPDCGGGDFSGQLLVGADGIHSAVRETMLGPDQPSFTGHVAWRGLVPTQDIPQALRPAPMANIWLGPGRHFVAYYLRRGELINFVAVEERAQWTQESWSQQADIAEARRAFDGWDPVVGAILDGCRQAFLWGLFDRAPLPRWSDGRAVLLGDSCHPMLPFQAQGAAMAIEDGHVLARHCEAAREGGLPSLQAALQAYQRQRQPRTAAMQRASRSNAGLFHAATGAARLKRRLMFAAARLFPGAARARLDAIYGLDVTAGG